MFLTGSTIFSAFMTEFIKTYKKGGLFQRLFTSLFNTVIAYPLNFKKASKSLSNHESYVFLLPLFMFFFKTKQNNQTAPVKDLWLTRGSHLDSSTALWNPLSELVGALLGTQALRSFLKLVLTRPTSAKSTEMKSHLGKASTLMAYTQTRIMTKWKTKTS